MLNDPVLVNDWHVVAYAPNLKEGKPLAARLLEEDIVLWRVGERIHAWRDLCIHRGTRLSLGKVENDTLICPYHGWTYNEEGQCIRIPAHPNQQPPAKACAKVYQAQEKYGWIWVTPGNPRKDVPEFPQWDDQSFHKIHCGPYTFKASGPRAIENFLDVTHFPFVHQGYLGDPNFPEINDYEAEISPDGVVARDIMVWQPDPDGSGKGAYVTYTYTVTRPLTAYFVKSSEGPRFAMYFTVTPVAQDTSIAWTYVAMDYENKPDEEIRAFEDMITWQDVPIVESQRPELLPLDLQAELHLRSDRTAIAYRKWLSQIGLTFGTA
ncbi:aromatic ring-hydroxylating dioxygenase subunit alpha [Ktedonosporobacter rubrisoli]|uniref:Aromatic ring-hydroxylating dioxygenase subunit alpha n=1 Tax=Ktedonosporobacter rubrisoli TaxID=2509675 RepID=A0A4P6JWA4_KTERU|nr:aromatic ring-hydroxylating dioxygenase subunit alpha [Ktedonosporobacter rubrisoli]QBD79967.1 aromatic ring-hydroxylating dioxygenase subunit alpha [Ktedonosporobacter rubrisoli]